jgi:DNA-directed RNA polymerase subunit RPC12/RpoP
MPVYLYRCESCRRDFEARHGMFFESQRCIYCSSSDVFKKPALSDKKEKRFTDNKKPGAVVDQYIKDVKEEVQKEKKKLKLEEK